MPYIINHKLINREIKWKKKQYLSEVWTDEPKGEIMFYFWVSKIMNIIILKILWKSLSFDDIFLYQKKNMFIL